MIDALENLQLRRAKLRAASQGGGQTAAQGALFEAIEEFRRARAVARLSVSPDVILAVQRIVRRLEGIDPISSEPDLFSSSEQMVRDARDNVVALGKIELRLDRV